MVVGKRPITVSFLKLNSRLFFYSLKILFSKLIIFKLKKNMKNQHLLGMLIVLLLSLGSCTTTPTETEETTPPETVDNTLTEEEKAAGWELLFDGKSMDKWRIFKMDTLAGWAIADGEMQALGEAGLEGAGSDIITKDTFTNFELSLEWKISVAGNSGIFFNVVEEEGLTAVYQSGPEYQLIDDIGFPQELEDWQKTAANYGMHNAPNIKTNKAGSEFNHSKIKVENGHVEHWLNGDKVVEYDLWTEEWEQLVKEGKWKDYPAYGRAKSGHIALQDHGNQCWFKNIKIRRL